jgi:endonuclease/exonuclease/phosphatase family metal-dependent hydrolase
MKKALKILLIIILIPIVLFGIFLLLATLKDYKPELTEIVYQSEKQDFLNDTLEYNLMIWNIGYCGLDASMDFFYDGGKMVFTTEENHLKNLEKIGNYIQEKSKFVDFILLQEVDLKSKRSYKSNEMDSIHAAIPNFKSFFGKNYESFFVPIPVSKPYGKVLSGVVTYSIYEPSLSTRYSFPGGFAWPKGMFELDRCFLVNRYNLTNGKELLVINTHNSAYDDGSQRKEQMQYLKNYIVDEYNKGNFVIIGGDWNQCPPNFTPDFAVYQMDTLDKMDIPADYLPEWNFIFQNKIPTNRRLQTSFDKNLTLTTVIDFYLISPNIELVDIYAEDLEFEHTDHQPVFMSVKFINDSILIKNDTIKNE